jgi:hypothetical protein
MSSKSSHSNFKPVVGEGYANGYFVGTITNVSLPLTAKNGKEYFVFEITITMITDPSNESVKDLTVGSITHRQATPDRRSNGTFNKMKNYGK